jgi:ribulose-5-phosphate 4-epimerase/fuculose-1-phosphate aldolase
MEDTAMTPTSQLSGMADASSAAERRTRVDLAAFYRLAAHYGLDDFIYNHISARVPGEADRYLVNPFGLLFEEISASNLIKIDGKGRVVASIDPDAECNVAVPGLHGVILEARPDLACVAHVHTPEGMAVSAMSCGLAPLTQTAMQLLGRTAYCDYDAANDPARLVESLGEKDILILRHHGLVACGRTISEAFLNVYNLVYACKAQVTAMAAGDLARPPPEAVTAPHYAMRRSAWHDRAAGVGVDGESLEWRAALRMLDRRDRSFRN